jgi:hypothetical protein
MIYKKINKILKLIFLPVKWIFHFQQIFKTDLWIIKGHEKYSRLELTITYSGDIRNKNFIVKLAFGDTFSETYIGKVWLWRATKIVQKKNDHCNLNISEIPKIFRYFYKKINNFFLPIWIDGDIDTTSNISNDSLKTDMRRVKKNKLFYEMTHEISKLHDWYYDMYLPYIKKTFNDQAFIFSYDYFRKNFGEQGIYKDLVLIKQGNEIIAGILMGYVKKQVYLYDLGVKNGDYDYVKIGAIGALFCYPTIYSKENGYNSINYGFSRPFLNDGVLQFKKKRGIRIKNTWNKGFVITPLSKTDSVKEFFLKNPFIYLNKKKYHGAIFVNDDQSLSERYINRIYKDYYVRGLSTLNIYKIGKKANNQSEIIPSHLVNKIRVYHTENFLNNSEMNNELYEH